MRLRVEQLLKQRGWTPYELSKESRDRDGRPRISMTMAYRLASGGDRVESVKLAVLEALCDTLAVEVGDLFERDSRRRRST
jgi:DNA-binding Xre family transcriptional regulator